MTLASVPILEIESNTFNVQNDVVRDIRHGPDYQGQITFWIERIVQFDAEVILARVEGRFGGEMKSQEATIGYRHLESVDTTNKTTTRAETRPAPGLVARQENLNRSIDECPDPPVDSLPLSLSLPNQYSLEVRPCRLSRA